LIFRRYERRSRNPQTSPSWEGGFTGLAAAAWLRLLAPEKSVAVLEAGRIGSGASGRTGGMILSRTAADDLPGLGDGKRLAISRTVSIRMSARLLFSGI
jgi:glycine/D-amino acid oxidase-like deaminating enzyme